MGMRYENFYYIRTLEKVEIALLDMFNDLKVNKYSGVDRKQIIKSVKVPLVTYSDKDFANWYQNQLVKRPLMPLPIMGMKFNGLTQNTAGRTQSTYLRNVFSRATQQWIRDIQPTPYFANYTLNCLMDSRSDLGQLVENILPYFNPTRFLRLYEFDFMPVIPDLERKVQVNLVSNSIQFDDEVTGSAHRFIRFNIDFQCEIELYRPLEIAEMIKYAELNVNVDSIIGKHQALIYPTDIVNDDKKPFEEVVDTNVTGLSILKTTCMSLFKKVDIDGNITYEEISVPDCTNRPTEVPDIKQIDLWFDADSDTEIDHSPYHRDFTLLNGATRTFLPGFTPGNGNGQEISGGGYEVSPSVQWNKILGWFGTNDGLMQSPFTFRIKLQFNANTITDAVFQQLSNSATDTIPEGAVFFDWGIMGSRPYFSFGTHGSKALNYTFKTKDLLDFNDVDVYEFIFSLYDEGRAGIFAYRINDSKYIVLNTERTK